METFSLSIIKNKCNHIILRYVWATHVVHDCNLCDTNDMQGCIKHPGSDANILMSEGD